MPWIALALQVLALSPAHVSTLQEPGEAQEPAAVVAPADAVATALSTRLSVGFATEDRGFRLESFADTARALAESLDYELWIEGQLIELKMDPEAAPGVPRPRLIAISSWDNDGEALAAKLGVEAVLVVKSASGKKGKETKKRYVPSSQMFTGAKGTAITYVGLSYRIKFELHAAVPDDGSVEWQTVSSWRVDEDERDAPKSINLGNAVDGRITLKLSDVIQAQARTPLGQALSVAAFRSIERLADDVAAAYAGLSEEQRTEFWVRAIAAYPVALAMPIGALMELAFTEWDEGDKPTAAEINRADGSKKSGRPSAPGPMDSAAIQEMLREAMSGTKYLYGPPLLRSVQRFVHRWSGDTGLGRRSREGLDELDELFKNHADLTQGSHERAHILTFGQIDLIRRATPRQLGPKSSFGKAVILLSEDCPQLGLFEDAPAPRALHGMVLRYTDEQAKAERKTKMKRFKAYAGAQLLVARDGKYVVVEKIPAEKLASGDLQRMLETALTPRWPHEAD